MRRSPEAWSTASAAAMSSASRFSPPDVIADDSARRYTGAMRGPGDVLYNFHWIVPGEAARAAQAYAGLLGPFLARHGIKSLINLRGPNPKFGWWRYERRVAEARGIEHIDVMLDSRHLPLRDMLVGLFDAFDRAPRPFLIKCSGGQDRTSLAAALYLVHRDGWAAPRQGYGAVRALSVTCTFQRSISAGFATSSYSRRKNAAGRPIAEWVRDGYDPARLEELARSPRSCRVIQSHLRKACRQPLAMVKPLEIAPGVVLWREYFSRSQQKELIDDVLLRLERAPFYRPVMPRSGKAFLSRRNQFRITGLVLRHERLSLCPVASGHGEPWPAIPEALLDLWRAVASISGAAGVLSRQSLSRRREDGSTSGSRRSSARGTGCVGFAGRRRAIPLRRQQRAKAPTQSIKLVSGDVVTFRRPGAADVSRHRPRHALEVRRSCRAGAGSTSRCAA